MTDNEIIKAVGCCIGNTKCDECPMFRTQNCMNKVFGYALDLINRQKEKIKEFDEKLVIRRGLIDYQKAEIEQWKEEANKYQNLWCIAVDDIEKVKSEAIKEFAERLKSKLQWDVEFDNKLVFESDIDNLVKEMTEVETNQRK